MSHYTKIFSCIAFAVCMISVCTPLLRAGEDQPSRSVTIQHEPDKTVIFMDMAPDEQVFVAYSDGSGVPVYPFEGIVFPSKTEGILLRLEIDTPRATKKKHWRVMWGVRAYKRSIVVGGPIQPPAVNEQEIKVSHIQLPVTVDGLELHLFPFAIQGDNMSCMFIAIAKDRELFKKHIKVQETRHFDWEKSFETAASFVTPPSDSDSETETDPDADTGADAETNTDAVSPEKTGEPRDKGDKLDAAKVGDKE